MHDLDELQLRPNTAMAGDLATVSGIAVDALDGSGRPTFLTFRIPDHAMIGAKLEAFEDFLCDTVEKYRPACMAHEAPHVPDGKGTRNTRTTRDTVLLLIKMSGVWDLVASRYGCRPRDEVHVQSARKHFVGHGRAEKDAVFARCLALGWKPNNHNESDAGAVWSLTKALIDPKWSPMATPLFARTA